ncbi:hypothetical protein ASPZODRAFT_148297 [Penicilliopsis zonata CBS 506.65]|uniref:EF-hand domain-containing protein n=1 Tax=Penicilliopsis zonata CBS 506.65 TaxID=1073090 RepID=A0A1L9SUW4_9EURO|nr:hypothetical protein ASPZODRAFT_148297 [Penicilliopsis zonata CBS 506.65]OJJ50911.1 hypothetical protein ASPZODRAFT_148297 [Penicilliopsis zonata CBS 506.65]
MLFPFLGLGAALLALSTTASAHGSHGDASDEKDWATRHMIEEHHIDTFDAGAFFSLHDFDTSGAWTADEVRKMYGLDDESNAGVSEDRKQRAVREVFAVFDPSNTGVISRNQWLRLLDDGVRLPDLGYGPGHHGDDEYEYEIHHFEKYHGEDATEEELTHPEDIEHFRKHDEEELAQFKLEQLENMQIVEANIPQKFLRNA